MFAYCLNNPINFVDRNGKEAIALQWWISTMGWLCAADLALPIGDVVYAGGVIILGALALAIVPGSTSQITYDEEETGTYGSPGPNKNGDDDDDDDDDYDDDYYDDDSNFGGRQKIGKSKGNTPGDNQRQNQQFDDATRGLPKKIKRMIHDAHTNTGSGYHDIKRYADFYRVKLK